MATIIQTAANEFTTETKGRIYTVSHSGSFWYVNIRGAGIASRHGSLRAFASLADVAARYVALRGIEKVAA
jgi:hypothetical protein